MRQPASKVSRLRLTIGRVSDPRTLRKDAQSFVGPNFRPTRGSEDFWDGMDDDVAFVLHRFKLLTLSFFEDYLRFVAGALRMSDSFVAY